MITPTTDGHESLAKDLRIFAEYESLPRCIKSLKHLDEGNGVQQTLVKHNAIYLNCAEVNVTAIKFSEW